MPFNLGLSNSESGAFPCVCLNLLENIARGHFHLQNAIQVYICVLVNHVAPK